MTTRDVTKVTAMTWISEELMEDAPAWESFRPYVVDRLKELLRDFEVKQGIEVLMDTATIDTHSTREWVPLPLRWWEWLLRRPPRQVEVRGAYYRITAKALGPVDEGDGAA